MLIIRYNIVNLIKSKKYKKEFLQGVITMILNIPAWSVDGITHYATTWKIFSDEECTVLKDSVIKSTTLLNGWDSNVLVPTGTVWYVKVLRHLKDSGGNDINNTEWIGPKPIINDNSNINDYLAPKFYIKEPYITEFNYVPSSGVSFKVEPYKGNVAYSYTTVYFQDENDNNLFVNTYDINSNNTITIPSTTVNFASINNLKVSIVHSGQHSVISKVFKETFYLKDVYYTIEGNTLDLDPYTQNNLIIKSNNVTNTEILSGVVNDINDKFVAECTYTGDILSIPSVLEFNSTYKVVVSFNYKDENNITRTKTDTVIITTRNNDEKEVIDSNFEYKYMIKELDSFTHGGTKDKVKTSMSFNTEEFYTNLIPSISNVHNKLDLFIFDKEADIYNTDKSNVLSLNEDYTLRLVTKTKGYYQTLSNNKLVLNFFNYDGYRDTITKTGSITTNLKSLKADMNKLVEVAGNVYLVGINSSNIKQIRIYLVNLENRLLTHIYTYTNNTTLTELTVAPYMDNSILITPVGNGVTRNLLYSVPENFISETLAMPNSFVNKFQYTTRLKNGNIFCIKRGYTDNVLEFYIMDIYKDTISVKQMSYNHGGGITNITKLKNGSLIFIINGSTSKYIYELV